MKVKELVERLKREYEETEYDSYETVVIENEVYQIWYGVDGFFVYNETQYGWEYNKEDNVWELWSQSAWDSEQLKEEEIEKLLEKEYTKNISINY